MLIFDFSLMSRLVRDVPPGSLQNPLQCTPRPAQEAGVDQEGPEGLALLPAAGIGHVTGELMP